MSIENLLNRLGIDLSDKRSAVAVTGRIRDWATKGQGRMPVSCTTFRVQDSMEGPDGIEDSWMFASKALRGGAGVAIHLGDLRPRGAENGKGLVSSGPVSFAQIYSKLNEILRRGGSYRNGAINIHIPYTHPDAREFVTAPRELLPWVKRTLTVDDGFLEWEGLDDAITAIKKGDLWLTKSAGNGLTFNVCVSGDTLVMTSEGPKPAKELVGTAFTAIVDGVPYPSTSRGFWSNGVKPVVELKTKDGHSIRLTPDHELRTPEGWVEAGLLEPGSVIHINQPTALDPNTTIVESVEPAGEEEVFDCTIEHAHCFDANGLIASNCLEIAIPHRGTCLLSHVNLGACKPADIPKAMRTGMEFLCELHRLTGVEDSGIYLSQEEDRQVGLGLLGLSNLLALENVRYIELVEALEQLLGISTGTNTLNLDAVAIAKNLRDGYETAAKIARTYGMERAFTIAPCASVAYRYIDRENWVCSPEISAPIDTQVDRDSATFGVESYDHHPNAEVAEEVGFDVHFRLNACIQTLMDRTGLAHSISFNVWSDVTSIDRELIARWLESPLKSWYYSLQVMRGTQAKDSALAALEDYEQLSFDFFKPLGADMEVVKEPLDIPCIGCAE